MQLFEEWTIGDVVFRNRIGVSPMCQYSAIDGVPNDWHFVHLGSRAVGGAGWIGVSTPFHFGVPSFHVAAIATMLVVALVTMVETTGDVIAVGELTGRPANRRGLADALRADGLATAAGGVFNTFPYTAFAQNVGLVGMTRVRSRWVVAAGGGMLVLLGLLPKLGAVVAAVPAPVLGGAGLAMFGTVAASGLRTLAGVEFEGNHNATVVAVSQQ